MVEIFAVTLPNPAEALGGFVGRGASAVGEAMLSAAGNAMARALAEACKRAAEGLLHFLEGPANISFTTGWWASGRTQDVLKAVATLAGVLILLFLFLALIQGTIAGDPGGMLRAALVEVPASIFGMVVLVAVAGLLVDLTDAASAMALAGVPGDLGHFFSGFGNAATIASGGLAAIVMLAVFLIGALLVWIELVVRASLVYLLIAFAPLTLAARVWPASRGAFRKLCELSVALIASKFAIALALGLGAAALAGGGPRGDADTATSAGMDLAGLLAGASLMLLAAFTPFVLLRLLPIVEAAAIAHGISRSPARGAQAGMQASYYAQGLRRLANGSGSNGSGHPPNGASAPASAASPAGGAVAAGGGPAVGVTGAAKAAGPAAVPVGAAAATGTVAARAGSAVRRRAETAAPSTERRPAAPPPKAPHRPE